MKSREELEKIFERVSKKFTFEDAHLELATDKRMEAIVKFAAEEFSPDEPLGRALQLEYDADIKQMIPHIFSVDISILLVSNSTDEIIAVRLSNISRKSDSFVEDLKKLNNKKITTLITFIHHKDEDTNAFVKYGVGELVHFIMLGVDRRYRKKGLATKIMDAAMQFYSEIGLVPCVLKGEGTSNYSQKIYEKFGFEIMNELPYNDYKVEGEVVFKNMGEHKSTKLYAKQIK